MPDAREVPGWLLRQPIAHRGLFRNPEMPENSLAAFAACCNAKVPVELDVRLLGDGQPVVFHDEDAARMTGVSRRVEELTAADCRDLRLLGTEEPIPLLTQVLEDVGGAVPLLIEVKTSGESVDDLMNAVLGCLQDYAGDFAVQSFNPAVLRLLCQNAPEICRGQLSSGKEGVPDRLRTRPDFIAYHLGSLPHSEASELRNAGVPLLAWTIRTLEERERAYRLADNTIFETDLPIEEYLAGDKIARDR